MLKGFELSDKNIKYVKLPKGEYQIDGVNFKNDSWKEVDYQVNSFDNIKNITHHQILDKVIVGDKIYTGEEFKRLEFELEEFRDVNDEWENIDKEYKYKKLQKLAQKHYSTITSISSPLLVSVKTGVIDTGSKHIKCKFENEDISGLFIYSQSSCWLDTVQNIFTKLGWTFKGNVSYGETKNEKIWGNSTHSCIRYVTAFGTYIFNDNWSNPYNKVGTLEDCKKWEKEDIDKISEIIYTNYNLEYGSINLNKYSKEIYNDVKSILNQVKGLNVNKKDNISHRLLINTCIELQNKLIKIINENEI